MGKDMNKKQEQAISDAMEQLKGNVGLLKTNEKVREFVVSRKKIEDFAAKKNPLIKEYIDLYKDAEKRPYTRIGRMAKDMKNIAAKQEILKVAAELCEDDDLKKGLLKQCEDLNNAPAMIAYEKYLKGLEYFAGIRKDMEPELASFYKNELNMNTVDDVYEKYRWEKEETDLEEAELLEPKLDEEEKAYLDEYQKLAAKGKAREIFTKQKTSNFMTVEEQFLGDTVKNMKEFPFTKRMTPSAFCVGRMLHKGYHLEDIMDPAALHEAKNEVAKEYLGFVERKDRKGYGEALYDCGIAMKKAFRDYLQKYKAELKTEQDLVMHADTLGMLSFFSMDLLQELPGSKNYVENITAVDMEHLADELGLHNFGTGLGSIISVEYNLFDIIPSVLAIEITHQMGIKMFLEEIQKEEPDFENNLLTMKQWGEATFQMGTLDEIKEIFGDSPRGPEKLGKTEVKVLASMVSNDFINENQIRYDRTRVPVKVTEVPEFSVLEMVQKEQNLEKVISRNGKQLIKTDVPARIDMSLKNLEKKNIRGKEKNNTKEFNDLLKAFDTTVNQLGNEKKSNAECLEEMAKLKEAASQYIIAKREQKGYTSKDIFDIDIDKKMLGKEEGASIFTSRGKERYAFAMQVIQEITKMEKVIREAEMHKIQEKNQEMNHREGNGLQLKDPETKDIEMEEDGAMLK
ncbi:MAG: hypothetical protein IKW30_07885 [Lachnospiraceae bacterium]|nr:hypothetical protein [Lachnospiraceae bacterium]